jgi:ribosomal protein S18 acetylase RimI-like enzyme
MQLRRLDPLSKAGPYQKLLANPVKSFSITEAQFERVQSTHPDLIVRDGESAVVGLPYRDYLEVHYAFADIEVFRDRLEDLFNRVTKASNKQQSPRGVLLRFRDRPNRPVAETVFWSLALDQGPQWVEMNYVAVPEQPEPENALEGGFEVREANESDYEAIARLDGEASGLPPLARAGVESIITNAKTVWVVTGSDGAAVGFVALRTEPGGWGVIDEVALQADVAGPLGKPLLAWCIAWLRNNGGRRVRRRVLVDDAASIALLREAGFLPGETGLDYTRPIDPEELKAKIEERKAHGTIIKFGDWR